MKKISICLGVLSISNLGLLYFLPTYLYPPYPPTMSEPPRLEQMRSLVSIGILLVMMSLSIVSWRLDKKNVVTKISLWLGGLLLVPFVIKWLLWIT